MRTENVAVMLTDMKGFTAATSRQSRAENERMLAVHDELVQPVVRAFGGRRVKTIGDAFLVLFRSPTTALLCGMAIQDRLWDYGRRVPGEERIEVRIVLSLGEVRLVGSGAVPSDVYGEAVNLAARLGWIHGEGGFNRLSREKFGGLALDGGYTVAGVTDDRYRPEWARSGAES